MTPVPVVVVKNIKNVMGKRIKVLRKGGYSSLLIFFTAEDAKKSRKSRKATGIPSTC